MGGDKHSRKRHRRRHFGKALFYAGTKGDGSPRAWTLADLAIAALCLAVAILAVVLFLEWLWEGF